MAAELAIRGWMVDLPRRGAPSIDLYAHRFQDSRTCGVQVKARSRGDFTLSDDLLTFADPAADSWVVLVTLGDAGSRSHFSVVPRNHVTLAMRAFQGHMDNEGKPWTRKMLGPQEFASYDEAWDLMERPANEAPYGLPGWVVDLLRAHDQTDALAIVPAAIV